MRRFPGILFLLDVRLIRALIFFASPPPHAALHPLPCAVFLNDSKGSDPPSLSPFCIAAAVALADSLLLSIPPAFFIALQHGRVRAVGLFSVRAKCSHPTRPSPSRVTAARTAMVFGSPQGLPRWCCADKLRVEGRHRFSGSPVTRPAPGSPPSRRGPQSNLLYDHYTLPSFDLLEISCHKVVTRIRRGRRACAAVWLTPRRGPLKCRAGIAAPNSLSETAARRALSSAGERSLHTGEVVGSIPTAPTKQGLGNSRFD
jgi:hypothetical protein